ncbi:D-glycero-beta-D-manno-heptose 1-phosphate adenylyltransferase [Niabella insulamsoli]|uniref:D-glycero-beta-D-manno-heptose 1-phosphate adenylyltransferase n=1 Tax=Niabella insulamsoli TaxID=3144874 RepID=UPI0031FCF430
MNPDIEKQVRAKIISLADAVERRNRWKQDQSKVVFTNGVFDILHAGHIQSLMNARAHGDRLIVGLNADASVKRLKGPHRPVVQENDRALLLAALSFVDMIILFEEDTPLRLIQTLLPDVLVKSADYTIENIVGAKEVLADGGEVKIMPFVDGLSTTHIVAKIKEHL